VDREAGNREKRGREVYGRREKREKNNTTLRNISQSKNCKDMGANKYRAGTGIRRYGKREALYLLGL